MNQFTQNPTGSNPVQVSSQKDIVPKFQQREWTADLTEFASEVDELSLLALTISNDPVSQAEGQQMADKIDEVINKVNEVLTEYNSLIARVNQVIQGLTVK